MKKFKLHKIAPLLSEILRKKGGFEVPENYFDSLEDDVLSKITVENFKIKPSSGFKTPENYLDSIENEVISKLKAEVLQNKKTDNIPPNYFDTVETNVFDKINSERKIITLKRAAKIVAPIAIAASLLIIFILNSTPKTTSFDSLDIAEIEQLIENGFVDIDTETLVIAFSDIDFSTDNLGATISDDEVLNYLYEEDLESIIYEN